tara:strand:- start:151 stop:402 length:252 start_codon:yes stop_codon:yes gene_type:complete
MVLNVFPKYLIEKLLIDSARFTHQSYHKLLMLASYHCRKINQFAVSIGVKYCFKQADSKLLNMDMPPKTLVVCSRHEAGFSIA